MEQEFYSIKEVADILKCHPNTIYNAIHKGFIVSIRLSDAKKSPYRISKKVVESIHSMQISLFLTKAKRS